MLKRLLPLFAGVSDLTPSAISTPSETGPRHDQVAPAQEAFPMTFVPVLLASVFLMTVLFYLTAWLAEDAYIDLRVVDNILSGFGPVWNVGERVQAFTSPLWVGVVSLLSYVTGSKPPIAALVVSLICDWIVILAAVVMGIRKPLILALALGCLFCSQSFLDYSSSGLENPLLQALGAAICLLFWCEPKLGAFKMLVALSLLCGLSLCSRLDALFVVGPVLVFQLIRRYREIGRCRAILAILLGMSPFVMWECFSIAYYGMWMPNTALAKLPPGYPRVDLVDKGLTLIQATAIQDPGTLLSIIAIPIALLVLRSRLWLPSMIASVANLMYVIWVGGDFMLGRFFSFVFVFSWLCLLAGIEQGDVLACFSTGTLARKCTLSLLLVAVAALSALSLMEQLHRNRFSSSYGPQPFFKEQIADERSYYNLSSSLRVILAGRTPPWVVEGEQVKQALVGRKALVAKRNVGMFGYSAGPNVYILDILSLGNPFLSHLPSCQAARPGHFLRPMPAGYAESLMAGRNAISDPLLAQLLDDTVLATRAPLNAHGRLAAIWRLNAGKYSDPQRLAAYVKTREGIQNVGVDRGSESVPCPVVGNGARTDVLAVADYGVQSPTWDATALTH
jgi:arabinofuranosyltransferase